MHPITTHRGVDRRAEDALEMVRAHKPMSDSMVDQRIQSLMRRAQEDVATPRRLHQAAKVGAGLAVTVPLLAWAVTGAPPVVVTWLAAFVACLALASATRRSLSTEIERTVAPFMARMRPLGRRELDQVDELCAEHPELHELVVGWTVAGHHTLRQEELSLLLKARMPLVERVAVARRQTTAAQELHHA